MERKYHVCELSFFWGDRERDREIEKGRGEEEHSVTMRCEE